MFKDTKDKLHAPHVNNVVISTISMKLYRYENIVCVSPSRLVKNQLCIA